MYAEIPDYEPAPLIRNPIDAVRTVFTRYFNFTGRASRPELWWWVLFVYVVLFVILLIGSAIAAPIDSSTRAYVYAIEIIQTVIIITWLGLLIPSISLAARRLRDGGYSPFMLFIAFIPFAGIALLIMYCMPSRVPQPVPANYPYTN